ncbi:MULTISPECIES: GGDEF domain-containing protein [unclassified Lebetimonas]|uniref:GGDEF domain-containing protein n=1 Tax=unclassified Lebetimonas TaxID=2648158 RepID=UPI000466AC7D|nr:MULTISPECIES: GGDEF domain-containing protein [unclassified Lebetimonas]
MKKRILLIIALIMIITTTLRTVAITYSFLNFSNTVIQNENNFIKSLFLNSKPQDYNKLINIINNSSHIKNIAILKTYKNLKTIYDKKDKTIISYIKLNKKNIIKITYDAKEYYEKLFIALIKLITIGLISLVIIILTVNYYLNPYLEIFENINKSTKEILKGKFDQQISTKLKGEAKDFVNSYNYFLNKLKESFGVIENKYTTLIEKEKSSDPLNDAKETIEQLSEIFKFKRLIEEDLNIESVLNRLINVIKNQGINNFILIGIDSNKKEIIYEKTEEEECCDVKENFLLCRAYRTKNEINSLKYPGICQRHFCENNYICIPFSNSGNFNGILKIMINNENEKNSIKNMLPFLKAYLNEISSILESKYTLELLHQQTIKDPLTGLFNRRYLENTLPILIASANRENKKLGFLMIDIDHFKQVNDTYGHKSGDITLEKLSEILKKSIRKSDIAVRYGGEEFLIILQNIKSIDDAKKVAEKIKNTMEKTEIELDNGKSIIKTVSIGISIYPDQCKKGWECIKLADIALYEAKNTGRNKVVLFNKEIKEYQNYISS